MCALDFGAIGRPLCVSVRERERERGGNVVGGGGVRVEGGREG